MDERKLIKLGNSSFAISLPKGWIDKANLSKGDTISLIENSNGEIIVGTSAKNLKKNNGKAIIRVDGKDKGQIRRELTSKYINGSTIFEFVGDINKDKVDEIKDLASEYVSCEIVEINKDSLIVKDFFNLEEIDVQKFVKRMDNNIKEMFKYLITSIEEGEISNSISDEIKEIDLDINKFYFLNSRILTMGLENPALASSLDMSALDLFHNWWMIFHLENMGDSIKKVAEEIKEHNLTDKEKGKILPILKKINEKYINSIKIFEGEIEEGYEIMEKGRGMFTSCNRLSKDKNPFLKNIGEKFKEIDNCPYQIIKLSLYTKGS